MQDESECDEGGRGSREDLREGVMKREGQGLGFVLSLARNNNYLHESRNWLLLVESPQGSSMHRILLRGFFPLHMYMYGILVQQRRTFLYALFYFRA